MTFIHLPVLVREVVELLSPKEGGTYLDATVGLGGHAEVLLGLIGSNGRVIGIDRDDEAIRRTLTRLSDDRLHIAKGSFSGMKALLGAAGISEVDGVLMDLGVSMMQLKDQERGFSFHAPDRLDMRMDRTQDLSAWEVVNLWPEKDLVRIFREYADEYRAPRVVRRITETRKKRPVETCQELASLVEGAIGRSGRSHPATRVFQALRIAVNRETEELGTALSEAMGLLTPGGRLCVISYHSLEDRIVKNFIREGARAKTLVQLTKKPVVPGREEIRTNPSARSAKLRGAEKP
jgi:16S rRNA (cytosine1402-N4)-methyltransferase